MSVNTYFYITKNVRVFTKELISDIQKVISLNKQFIQNYLIEDDVILLNFKNNNMESFFVTTNKDKTFFTIPFPDGTLYSGFKYVNSKHNKVACILSLLLKYHLKEDITISSDGLSYCLDSDWEYAIEYLKDTFNYNIEVIPQDGYPKVIINSLKVKNSYDEDNSIFNQMFKVVIY